MRWDDLRQSTNIEDDREASASRGWAYRAAVAVSASE
jgi:predicted metalloprotease